MYFHVILYYIILYYIILYYIILYYIILYYIICFYYLILRHSIILLPIYYVAKVVAQASGENGIKMTGYLSRKHTMEGSHKKASQR